MGGMPRLRKLLNATLTASGRLKRALLGERLRLANHPHLLQLYERLVRLGRVEEVEIHGHRLRLDPLDSMHLSLHGRYEEGETRFVQQRVRPGDVVFDVGAHVGYFTLLFARGVGPGGRVFAFEPHPDNRALLVHNLAANGYANVEVSAAAVARADGHATLYASLDNTGDNALHGQGPGFTVETRALDGYCEQARGKRAFFKLDTQGHELDVFAGAHELFAACAEVTVLFEFWPHGLRQAGRDPREVFRVQDELGFAGHTLDDAGRLQPLDPDALLASLQGEAFSTVVWTR